MFSLKQSSAPINTAYVNGIMKVWKTLAPTMVYAHKQLQPALLKQGQTGNTSIDG